MARRKKRVSFLTPYHPYPPPSRALLNYKYNIPKRSPHLSSSRQWRKKPIFFFFSLSIYPRLDLEPFFIDAAGRYLSLSTHLFCYFIIPFSLVSCDVSHFSFSSSSSSSLVLVDGMSLEPDVNVCRTYPKSRMHINQSRYLPSISSLSLSLWLGSGLYV